MNGRYASQPQLPVPQDDGTTRPMSTPRISLARPAAAFYQVREGDRLDLLARTVFDDTTAWWALADTNPQTDPLALERTGTTLAVPGA